MEERLTKALEFANYRQTLNNQLQKTKIRVDGLLTIAKSGGIFKVNQELICFLDYLLKRNITNSVILDSNNLPIEITDISSFLEEVTSRYFEVVNDYSKDYQKIRQARNVKSIVDLKVSE